MLSLGYALLSRQGLTARVAAGLLAVALAAAGALVVGACGALASANAAPFSSDGGSGADSGVAFDATTDAPYPEAGPDGPPPVLPTTALLVQASPSLNDVRLCWAVGGVVAPVLPFPSDGAMPGSNYPGIPLGGVVAMSDATPLLGADVTLYAVDADNLASVEHGEPAPLPTCDLLLACGLEPDPPPPCLRYNLDYWPLAPIVSGGVAAQRDNVVALNGCLPSAIDPNASATLCGAGFDPLAGNLHADILQLSPAPDAGSLSVQAAQLSPALAALEGDAGYASVSFGPESSDAAVPVAALTGEGSLAPLTVLLYDGGLQGYGQVGFSVDVAGDDSGAGHLWMSLADSQQLEDPTEDPVTFFGQPRVYLVAVLGDPHAAHAFGPPVGDAGYDGKGLHVLVMAAPQGEAGVADAGGSNDAGGASDAEGPSDAGAVGDAADAGIDP
ncbi:MAG: hypothetical protein ABSE49_23055 [Polyangiaceae bacterium]|jgi:hypothetical protein